MPLVVTTVNLDFDKKEEFIRKFGKAELSAFLRKAMEEKLEEKNREASINLSAIQVSCLTNNDMHMVPNKSLDLWIEHVKNQNTLAPLIEIYPKARHLHQLLDARIKGLQPRKRRPLL